MNQPSLRPRLRQAIHDAAAAAPAGRDQWPAIRARLSQQEPSMKRIPFRPRWLIVLLPMALLIIVVIGGLTLGSLWAGPRSTGGAGASTPAPQKTLVIVTPTPDLHAALDSLATHALQVLPIPNLPNLTLTQMQRLDLVQPQRSYTVTLSYVYADAERVVVIYAVQGPPGRSVGTLTLLADPSGPRYTPTEGMNNPADLTQRMASSMMVVVQAFAPPAPKLQPGNLPLHLSIDLLDLTALVPATPPRPTPADTLPELAGPFVFDFIATVHGGPVEALVSPDTQVHGTPGPVR